MREGGGWNGLCRVDFRTHECSALKIYLLFKHFPFAVMDQQVIQMQDCPGSITGSIIVLYEVNSNSHYAVLTIAVTLQVEFVCICRN